MSGWDFHVGQKVVCVKNSVHRVNDLGLPGFRKGQIFTVAGFAQLEPYGLFLRFKERDWRNTGHHSGFRPLRERKTDISIFTAMLNPVREDEPA